MEASKRSTTNRRPMWAQVMRKRWTIFALVIILGLAGIVGFFAAREAFQTMMGVSGLSQQEFDASTAGSQVDVLLEVTSMPTAKTLSAILLEPATDGSYRRTSTTVVVSVANDVKVVMGQPSDVKSGAVMQVSGKRSDANNLTAQKIVILTGYVAVQ